MNLDPLQLLKKALLAFDQKPVVDEVRRHAAPIREALEAGDVEFSDAEAEALGGRPDWAAAVYGALAGPEEEAGEENQVAEAIRELRARTDGEIAQAFLLALENLPPAFRDWPRWFRWVPEVPSPVRAALGGQAVVRGALPYAEGLVRWGLTPAAFVEGARGLELLCNRLTRETGSASGDVGAALRRRREAGLLPALALLAEQPPEGVPVVPYPLLVAQVRGTPQCPPEAAEQLLRWLVGAARLRPFLIRGYRAEPLAGSGVRLDPLPVLEDRGLVWRWGGLPREDAEPNHAPARLAPGAASAGVTR